MLKKTPKSKIPKSKKPSLKKIPAEKVVKKPYRYHKKVLATDVRDIVIPLLRAILIFNDACASLLRMDAKIK